MPGLVDSLAQAGGPPPDVSGIVARADALSGREVAAPPLPAPPPARAEIAPPPVAAIEPEEEVVAAEGAAMDPVLQDIFRKETAGHVAVVRDFIERCGQSVAPYGVTEALYRVHVVCSPADVPQVRDHLFAELERANYPIQEIGSLSEGEDQVELAAALVPTTADPAELDAVVSALEAYDVVESATWTVSTLS